MIDVFIFIHPGDLKHVAYLFLLWKPLTTAQCAHSVTANTLNL